MGKWDDINDIMNLIKNGNNDELGRIIYKNPSIINRKTTQGISLLMFACYCRNSVAISILKSHTKTLNIFEGAGTDDPETVEKELITHPGLINSFSPDGFTSLGLACFFGNTRIVQLLLEKGADPNLASNNQFHVAPIHSACAVSNYDLVEILIKNGAEVNVKQMQDFTPLHAAANNGQINLVRLLIKSGAQINAKTITGQTPLSMALEKDFKETAQLIKDYGGQ